MRQRFVAAALAASAIALTPLACEGGGNDPALAEQVRERLRSEPTLASRDLQAHAQGGNIVLSGNVQTAAERARAEDVAGDVPGVGGVINQIEVAGGGATPPPVGAPPPADRPTPPTDRPTPPAGMPTPPADPLE